VAIYVALDVGTKTIGMARAEAVRGHATPWTTLRPRKGLKKDIPRLLEIVRAEEVEAWIVGLPIEKDGTEGRAVRLARQVGDAIGAASGRPVHYQDETLSSKEATMRLHEAGYGDRRLRPIIDQAAAAIILQRWLDGEG
jgi:putative Holliday junction resolvase